jgi:hypothetical protein
VGKPTENKGVKSDRYFFAGGSYRYIYSGCFIFLCDLEGVVMNRYPPESCPTLINREFSELTNHTRATEYAPPLNFTGVAEHLKLSEAEIRRIIADIPSLQITKNRKISRKTFAALKALCMDKKLGRYA